MAVREQVVVDLWGGWADPATRRPWAADTLVNIFSVGKGLAALCAARLCSTRGLDLDAPVARYWPEFAGAGKAGVTVRHLLSHQAGVPAIRRRLPPGAMLDHALMCDALARQEPWWPPGQAHGYHTNTFGFLVGELVRRIDGRTLGAALRLDIAGPLDADVHIGLSDDQHGRVAPFLWPMDPPVEAEPPGMAPAQLMEYNAYFNPSGLSGAGVVNTAQWRRAEIPSTNSHATARAWRASTRRWPAEVRLTACGSSTAAPSTSSPLSTPTARTGSCTGLHASAWASS